MNANEQKMVSDALQFVKELEVPAIALTLEVGNKVPDEPVSTMGGSPSLPFGAQWPKCAEGRPLVFLAQVNLVEMPSLAEFPETGILQFFVKDDVLFGLDDGEFLVQFIEDTTNLVRRKAPVVGNTPFGTRLHSEGAAMKGTLDTGQPSFGCWQVSEFEEKLEALGATDAVYHALDEAFDEARPGFHYIGGHPCFDQGDVRGQDDREFTSVLLQMGYQSNDDGWEVCWGDAGQATFITKERDLRKRDFSKVLFNWDCA